MPLKKCSSDGKNGYKWGSEGKCYTGPGAKKKAIKQGLAIEGPEKFYKKASEENIFLHHTDIKNITSWMHSEGYDLSSVVMIAYALSSNADRLAGYPPNCNDGYIEKDGKCVPKKDNTY